MRLLHKQHTLQIISNEKEEKNGQTHTEPHRYEHAASREEKEAHVSLCVYVCGCVETLGLMTLNLNFDTKGKAKTKDFCQFFVPIISTN